MMRFLCSRFLRSYSEADAIASAGRFARPRCSSSIHAGTGHPARRMQSATACSRGASSSTKNVTALPRRPARPVRPTLHAHPTTHKVPKRQLATHTLPLKQGACAFHQAPG